MSDTKELESEVHRLRREVNKLSQEVDKHAEWIARLLCDALVYLACCQLCVSFTGHVNPHFLHYCQTERSASDYALEMLQLRTLLTELKAKTRQQEGHIAWLHQQVRLKVPIKTEEEMYKESEESSGRALRIIGWLLCAAVFFIVCEWLVRV